MKNVALAKQTTHAPRTQYNSDMWAAVQSCKGINTAAGVSVQALVAHCMEQVPAQQPSHALAHVKYLLRSKGALVAVASK